jgi:hypothetical protein
MSIRMGYIYLALAAAYAVFFGAFLSSYWIDDAVAFATVSGAVCVFCFLRIDEEPNKNLVGEGYSGDRSRIAHYVRATRTKSLSQSIMVSYAPFERALRSRQDWRTLSPDDLEEIASKNYGVPLERRAQGPRSRPEG